MKRKNLEKAIIMGLMAASISVPVWAADYVKTNEEIGQGTNLSEYDNIILNYDSNFNGTSPIWVGKVTIDANNKFSIVNTKQDQTKGKGINLYGAGVDIKAKNIVINTYDDGIFTTNRNPDGPNLNPGEDTNVSIHDFETLNITSEIGFGIVNNGNPSKDGSVLGNIYITADPNTDKRTSISISGGELIEKLYWHGIYLGETYNAKAAVKNVKRGTEMVLEADDMFLDGTAYGVWTAGGTIRLNGDNVSISAVLDWDGKYTERYDEFDVYREYGIGVYNNSNAETVITSTNQNQIHGDKEAVKAIGGTVNISGKNNYLDASYDESLVTSVEKDKVSEVERYAINASGKSTITINAVENNYIDSIQYGVNAKNSSNVDITGSNNIIKASLDNNDFGSKHAIKADSKANVNLNATSGENVLYGVVYAKDDGTNVTLNHNITNEAGTVIKKGSGSNYIYSSAHGSTEGVVDRSSVVAALYAQNQGQIDIVAGEGGINHIETSYSDIDKYKDGSERTIWAQQGGTINITGTTIIKSSNDIGDYENGFATNSRGIAITAGSEDADADLASKNSTVKLNYGEDSAIYGDIVAGRGGDINISRLGSISTLSDGVSKGIEIQGNALAANGGKLNMDLGEGSTWYGRADDYQDAGQFGHGSGGKDSFFNPAFSDDIKSAGTVNVTLGKGSQWYLTGQSWITTVNGVTEDVSVAEKPVIDIANSNVWLGDVTSTALTIGTLNGNVRFNMHLDGNELANSDMVYIKNAKGEYDVSLNEAVTTAEINNNHDGLRFATVGKGSNAEFRVGSYDSGFFNVEYEVGTDLYEGNEENVDYNGDSLDTNKPGNSSVDEFFSDKETKTLNEITEKDQGLEDTTNFKIIGRKGEDLSDGGKTVVNMSKVNYSNAVYMDRLNKRLGEARYINTEEDQGMWVRMRHDRIGKDNEFRIMNTMYELGYDEKQECDNGERRVGAAIDYMDGSSEYTGVGGSGDVSRKGIWLYDTWLGDKGHYSDFVAKWGHISNDFTLYKGTDKITGDFSNNVYSISAEYGRKKDIGNNWYFEPQVQLQYARVTDANYTTSQGTEVSLDAINSLIARAGFRLGKDLGERSTVYFKADLLHEFLGDQDIAARDKTTDGKWTNVTYGNEGTWCDIGFGFATAMSKTSYAYLDVETSLGNDYEETYQINAGLQWSF